MRLRAACDFDVVKVTVTRPNGYSLPSCAALEPRITELLAVCRPQFASPPETTIIWTEGGSGKSKKEKKGAAKDSGAD